MLHDFIERLLKEVFVRKSAKEQKKEDEVEEVFVKEKEQDLQSGYTEEQFKALTNLFTEQTARLRHLQLEKTQVALIQLVERTIEPGYVRNQLVAQVMLLEDLNFSVVIARIKEAHFKRGLISNL